MKKLLLIFSLICAWGSSFSSHLMGGNIGYEYLGPSGGNFSYKIILTLYYNCDQFSAIPNPEPSHQVNIYQQDIANNPMGGGNKTLQTTLTVLLVDSGSVTPPVASGCAIGQGVCIRKGVYEGIINLPMNFNGYHVYFENFARNAAITNLLNPGGTGMAFHAYIPPTLVNNSSPVFFDDPVPFLCVNDTTSILNTAFDPDGDQLLFSFVTPFNGSGAGNPLLWPITPVTYQGGFSVAQPFGAGGYSFINGANGLTAYLSPITGNFVVCVEIREFRNNNLIGVSRRDIQLLVINCTPNDEPVLTSNGGNVQFTVQECSPLCFPITFSDPDADSISLEVSSPLGNTTQFNPAATFDTLVTGNSPITSNFCWTPGCGTAQALPYLVIASATDNGCPPKTENIIYEITVTPPTAPTSINGPNPVCANTTATYTTNLIPGYTYNWSVSNGSIVSGQGTNTVSVSFPAAGSATLTVNSVNSCGCPSQQVTLNITVLSAPVANAGPDTTVCMGDTVSIGGTPTGPAGSTFVWSPSGSLTLSTASNPGAFPYVNTTYVVTVDNGSSCTNTDTVIVSVQQPVIDAGVNDTICINDTTQLNATGGTSYLWSPVTGLSDPNIFNPFANPLVSTDYVVTGTDAMGCTNSDTVSITVIPQPSVSISGDTVICLNESTQLTASGATNYSWSPATGLSATNISNPVASPVATTTYTVIAVNSNGCSDTVQVTVIVNPLPAVNASGDTTMCAGSCQQLNANGALTYVWSPATGLNNTTISNPLACPVPTITYTVTGTDANGCTDTADVEIIVNPLPNADAGTDVSICISDSVQLSASGGMDYLWSPSAGLSDNTVFDPVANPPVTTTYTVTVTDADGCVNSDSVTVTVNPQPVISISNDTTICAGDTAQLLATGGASYSWSPAGGLNASNIDNPLAFPAVTTLYTVIVTDVNNCSDTADVLISVNQLPNITAGNDTAMCAGECTQLNASGGVGYSWSPSAGLDNSAVSNPIACPGITTLYTVTGTDANGCSDTASVTVTIHPLPVVDAGQDTSLCLNDTIQLNASGGNFYSWSPAAGLSSVVVSNPLAFPVTTTLYTVTVTDGNGCVNSDSVLLTVHSLPVANAGPDTSLCLNDTVQLNGSGGLFYSWTPSAGLSDSTVFNPLASPVITTSYVLTVTDNNSCTDSDTMNITVYALPLVTAGNDTSACLTNCVQLVAGGAMNYTWSPGTGLSDSTVFNPVACPNATTSYVVTGIDGNGCSDSDTLTFNVFALPVADAGIDLWLCPGDTTQLSGSGGTTYSWSPGSSLSDSTLFNPGAFPSDTTLYVLTVTDTNNCTDDDSMFVFVNDMVPTDAGTDKTICEGDSVQIGGVPTAPPGSVILWSPSASLSSASDPNPVAFPTVTTTYIVYVVNDTCSHADTVTVFVNPTPAADAGPPLQMCLNDTVQLNASGGIQYTWTPSSSLDNDTISNPFAFPALTTAYYVTVADTNGCSGTDSTLVTVYALPSVNAGADTAVCTGDTAQLSATSGFVSYHWSPGTMLSDSTIFNPLAFPDTTTMYILTVSDTNSCVHADTLLLTVNPLPPADAGADTSICFGSTAVLSGSGGIAYAWTPGATLSDSLIASPFASPLSTITYYLDVTDGNGCMNSDSVIITVNPLPVVSAGNDTAMCFGEQAQLSGTPGFPQYGWSPGNTLSDSTIFNPVAQPAITTEYVFTVTDSNGCMNIDSVLITINQLPDISAGPDTSNCRGDTLQLFASGGISYNWWPNTVISDTASSSPFVWPDTTITYYVSGMDAFGCYNTDTILVEVFHVTGFSDTTICKGDTIQLNVNGPNATVWNWNPATGLSDPSVSDPMASPQFSITYNVVVTDAAGCRDTFSIDVWVIAPPNAGFTWTAEPSCDGLIVEFENQTIAGQTYYWVFSDGTTSTEPDPTHVFVYNSDLSATLVAVGNFGCNDTATATQPILGFTDYYQVTVPNVFTPNGDGINDVYQVPGNGNFDECEEFTVFNRWGQIVYRSNGEQVNWDGTFNGKKVSHGVYYYLLTINGIQFKGNITVLE